MSKFWRVSLIILGIMLILIGSLIYVQLAKQEKIKVENERKVAEKIVAENELLQKQVIEKRQAEFEAERKARQEKELAEIAKSNRYALSADGYLWHGSKKLINETDFTYL